MGQRTLNFSLKYFDALFIIISQIENDDKIERRNIQEKNFSLLCLIFYMRYAVRIKLI